MDGRKVSINNPMSSVIVGDKVYSISEMYNYNGVDYFIVNENSQSSNEQTLWPVYEWNYFL